MPRCYKRHVQFRILGPLEVLDDEGRPLDLGGPRLRALLLALLIRAGKVVSQDRLIDELWGEQPPRTAVTSLQNSISQLRKAARRGRPANPAARATCSTLEPEQLDARVFERLVTRGALADG